MISCAQANVHQVTCLSLLGFRETRKMSFIHSLYGDVYEIILPYCLITFSMAGEEQGTICTQTRLDKETRKLTP